MKRTRIFKIFIKNIFILKYVTYIFRYKIYITGCYTSIGWEFCCRHFSCGKLWILIVYIPKCYLVKKRLDIHEVHFWVFLTLHWRLISENGPSIIHVIWTEPWPLTILGSYRPYNGHQRHTPPKCQNAVTEFVQMPYRYSYKHLPHCNRVTRQCYPRRPGIYIKRRPLHVCRLARAPCPFHTANKL